MLQIRAWQDGWVLELTSQQTSCLTRLKLQHATSIVSTMLQFKVSVPVRLLSCVCVQVNVIGLEWDWPLVTNIICTLRTYKRFSMSRRVCMCVSSRARSHCPAQVPRENRAHHRHTLHMGRLLKQNKQSIRSCRATAHTRSNKGMHFLSSCAFIPRASTDVYRSLPLHCIGTCNKTRGKGSNKSVRVLLHNGE